MDSIPMTYRKDQNYPATSRTLAIECGRTHELELVPCPPLHGLRADEMKPAGLGRSETGP